MSSKYQVHDNELPHFVTFTVVGCLPDKFIMAGVDVFSRPLYKDLLVESLSYCQQHKGLLLHAWVIMTNHVHLIVSTTGPRIPDIVRDIKKYTSKPIIQAISTHPAESRREWMLNLFAFAGRNNANNTDFQFWKQDYHPIALDTAEKASQRLRYFHENPVRSGLVWEPWHYKYSSAIDYYTTEKGLLPVKLLL
jgi:REP element-mobilizing transposase RayT